MQWWWKRHWFRRWQHWVHRKRLRLRVYQQLLILLLLTVALPLGIIGAWVYDIHDSGLRRQVHAFQNTLLSWYPRQLEATLSEQALQEESLMQSIATLSPSTPDTLDSLLRPHPHLEALLLCEGGQIQQVAYRSTPLPQWAKPLCAATSLQTSPWQVWHKPLLASPQRVREALPKNAEALPSLRWIAFHPLPQRPRVTLVLQYKETPTLRLLQQLNDISNERGLLWQWASPTPSTAASPWVETTQAAASGRNHAIKEVVMTVPRLGLKLHISHTLHGYQSELHRSRSQTIFLLVAAFVLSLLLAMAYAFGLMRNFRQLIKGIQAMAGGNHHRRIRLIINWVTPFEVLYLTGEFNRMAKEIAQQLEAIRQANAELASLDAAKSDLIDTVSHELRTPLANIQGYTSQLLRHEAGISGEQRRQHLKVIQQQSRRLARLVEDLLVIPDLEKQRLRVQVEPVFLCDALKQALYSLSESQRERIQLPHLLPKQDEEPCVEADPHRLEQVLVNVLENACKYAASPDDAVHVALRQEGEQWCIEVSNPCQPLSPSQLERLFSKFYRVEAGLQRTTRGSGLGLYISKALMEAMGGTISLSQEGRCFQVRICLSASLEG